MMRGPRPFLLDAPWRLPGSRPRHTLASRHNLADACQEEGRAAGRANGKLRILRMAFIDQITWATATVGDLRFGWLLQRQAPDIS
jgi:hypothetical protein